MNPPIFEYQGQLYPDYLRRGNAMRFIEPVAQQFCQGNGLDVGCGPWPLKGAEGIDAGGRFNALDLPRESYDYIFSSHCLEHIPNTVQALEHWKSRIRPGGVLFLYLPHADMAYWRPQNCRKHMHTFWPVDIARMVTDLGFVNVIHSERDLVWSFAVVGFLPENGK